MHRIRLMIVFLGVTIPLAGQIAPYVPSPVDNSGFQSLAVSATGKPVARVNGIVLTDKDLVREMLAMFPYANQHGGKFPKAMEADIRRGALSMIEFEELVFQEAERRKMNVLRARLDSAVEAFNMQFSSPDQFRTYVNTEFNGSLPNLRERIRRSILIDDLLKAEVTQKALVTDAQVRAYYDSHRSRFFSPESVAMQTISISIPENASPQQLEEAKKHAEDILRQAKSTKNYESFGLLAEKFSQDDWHVMMGDHHSVSRNEIPPEIAKIVWEMPSGQVSELIRSENWFCIVRVNSRKTGRQLPFAEVRTNLKKELQGNKVEDLRSGLHRQLRAKARVEEL
jgi:peptidyl-prolyl cis-trans isomerase SurA